LICCLLRLDFVVKFAKQNHKGVAENFVAELQHVGRGAKVAYSNITVELISLERSMKKTTGDLEKIKDVASKMYDQLESRSKEYSLKIKEMSAKVDRMEAERKEVLKRFGEDEKSGEIGELFQSVVDFIGSWQTAEALLDADAADTGAAADGSTTAGRRGGSAAAGGAAGADDDDNKIESKMAEMKAGTFRRRAGSAVGDKDARPAAEDVSARQKELERERLRRR
jgi:hypothetical protein